MAANAGQSRIDLGRLVMVPFAAGMLAFDLPLSGHRRWRNRRSPQGYRALREEQVLLLALPGYRAYRARTAALLPGVF